MTYTEFSRKNQVKQQDHSMKNLMLVEEEDLEDEAVEEALAVEKALAVVVNQSLVTTVEL